MKNPQQLDKAFYWNCHHCGDTLTDGDEAIFVYDTFISGNTPVHIGIGKAFHKKCYSKKCKNCGSTDDYGLICWKEDENE